MADEHEVIDAEDVVIDDIDDADDLDAAQAEVDKAAATVDVSKVKEMTTSVRNELEAINEEMAVGKMENCINGVPLPTFIFQRFVNRLDPIEYCQNVLRDHYPEEKRYLHSNQIEFIRAACNPKVRRTAALMARQCLVKGTVIHTRDGGLLRIEDHPAAWHTRKDAPVLEIHAHGGHVVTCTENHPIFTPDGWKQAADLHVGDKVVCMYAWSKWSDRYAVISMDACELMGMFSAVTHVSIVEDNTLRVVCNSKVVMNRLKHLVRAVCTDVVMHHPARSQGVLHVPMDNTLATLVEMFGQPGQVNVNVVGELSKAQTCAYLHGVYNMTATVATLRRKYITYNADANMGTNKLQADVVRELLLKLGVRARVKPACGKWYIVRFKGERNRRVFIDNIGVPLGRKFPKCDEVKKMKFITGEDGEQLYVSRVTSIKPAGTADVYDVEYPGKGWFIAGGIKVHNSGKCLAPGTEVRMADGSLKKVEDIVVGDQLYPVDRGYAVVKKVDKVVARLGTVKANGRNTTAVQVTADTRFVLRKYSNKHDVILSLGEYVARGVANNTYQCVRCDAVIYPYAELLPVDPYFIGVWLYRGKRESTMVKNVNNAVADWLYNYAKTLGMTCKVYGDDGVQAYRITSLHGNGSRNVVLDGLRVLGLADVSDHKFIPSRVFASSLNERRAVAAGILDVGGHVVNASSVELYISKNVLADDVARLFRSIGFRVSVCVQTRHGKFVTNKVLIYGDFQTLPMIALHVNATAKKCVNTYGFAVTMGDVADATRVELDEATKVVLGDCTLVSTNDDGVLSLAMDTPVLLVDGTLQCAGDLRPGDAVVTAKHLPSIVTSVTRGEDVMYDVVPHDGGQSFAVNSVHLLSLLDGNGGLCTAQAADVSVGYHSVAVRFAECVDVDNAVHVNGNTKHGMSVVMAGCTRLPIMRWHTGGVQVDDIVRVDSLLDANLTHIRGLRAGVVEYPCCTGDLAVVDPYYLGLWVGDGHYVSTKITSIDQPIVDYLHAYAERLGLVCVDSKLVNGHVVDHKIRQVHVSSVNPLLDKLKQLGVVGTQKHVPLCVMNGSVATRRAFMAGWIDSDGTGRKSGVAVSMKNLSLAQQCVHLFRSLGFRATIYAKKNGYDVYAMGSVSSLPILLERKQFVSSGNRKYDARYFGFKVNPVNANVKCVQLCLNAEVGDEILLEDFTRVGLNKSADGQIVTLAFGTRLVLADGTVKAIEQLTKDDQLLVLRGKVHGAGWRLTNHGIDCFDVEVHKRGDGTYYGFTLDDMSNKLFLLADGTVTHNTESVASICGYLCDNYPQMRVGVFTPRLQQAETDIGRMSMFYQMNENLLNNQIVSLNKDKVELSNKSYAMAVSASDQSNIEGYTFDVIILDEAQKVSNYTWSERITPMGGATNAKLIKVGTPKTRNHFYDCVEGRAASSWKVFRRDWTQCPQLWALDSTMLPDKDTGELRPYSTFVLAQMPKALKQWYFPNNPETWTEGSMDIIDFRTQYMLEFVDGAGTYLSKDQVEALGKGEFDWLEKGVIGEKYVAGIDFAGSNPDGDATHVTVLRVNPDGSKHKVFAKEFNDTPYPQQMYEIARLFGGYTPVFQVSKIFADYTGCGAAVVQTLRDEYGLSMMEGIIFNQTDRFTHSGMNMKNIMYAKFLQALDGGKFVYPSLERFTASELPSAGKMNTGFYHKMIGEWADLEVITGYTVNKKIQAPKGYHDDVCDADVLANFTTVAASQSRMPRPAFARVRW